MPEKGAELRTWWRNNYETQSRYETLPEEQQTALTEIKALLPQKFEEYCRKLKAYVEKEKSLPEKGQDLRTWWMNNYETKSRYETLPEAQQTALTEIQALLPQKLTFEEYCEKIENYLNLNGNMPPRETTLGTWWHNKYQRQRRYNELTKAKQKRLDKIAAKAAKMQKGDNPKEDVLRIPTERNASSPTGRMARARLQYVENSNMP